jgi:hypothetical protein
MHGWRILLVVLESQTKVVFQPRMVLRCQLGVGSSRFKNHWFALGEELFGRFQYRKRDLEEFVNNLLIS